VRIALAAAFLLVLQSMTASLAMGMMAGSTEFDAFGNPLCITGVSYGDGTSQDGGQHHIPECCTMGCPMLSGAQASPPDQNPIVLRDAPVAVLIDARYGTPPRVAPDHDPGSPRAPPLSA